MTIKEGRQAMFRKPTRTSPARQSIWQQMRQQDQFSIAGLARSAGVAARTVRNYVQLLMQADYVEQGRRQYWLNRNTGSQAPDLTPSKEFLYDPNKDHFIPVFVSPAARAPEPDSAEGKLWLGLRILRVSTAGELSTVTELSYRKVTGWLRSLHRFDYVREAGESGGEMAYRLVQSTGPRAPSIDMHRGMLHDHNTQQIISL
ncbi:hypothetical protein NX722_07840 [Endozoicomonas gorgoniicola]|uniref:Helix-turn-helix type 11 domain-containing protein n=1 Tax=Endozoicomonas gorgoniicola TaxID=1234144 RepID=A0ABT3MT57_9GAMM|nr:hypothetical protein [Endozoicomonas gorgoniicola]MCW7552560.1 hypothetical protein [Endozoicomonas gorgoniicola]